MDDRPKDAPPQGPKDVARSFREAQPYVDASWQLIAAVAVLTFAGYWADKHFGTRPWLLVTGAMLGFAGGMWAFLKAVLAIDRKKQR